MCNSFKTHFKTAQIELKTIRGPTVPQAGYQYANMMANQIRDDLANKNAQMMVIIQTMRVQEEEATPPPPQLAANETTNDKVKLEIVRLLRNIQQNTAQPNDPNPNPQDENNNTGGQNGTKRIHTRCISNDTYFTHTSNK